MSHPILSNFMPRMENNLFAAGERKGQKCSWGDQVLWCLSGLFADRYPTKNVVCELLRTIYEFMHYICWEHDIFNDNILIFK